jgi:hypothetical protein
MADAAAVEHDGAVAVGGAAPELGDAAAAPAELSARLPTGVTAAEFADSSPAVQALILARAAVVFADEFAASQLPLPPPDVRVSLPTGVTSADFANATAGVKQIIRGASTVTKKRAHDDVGSVVARSAAASCRPDYSPPGTLVTVCKTSCWQRSVTPAPRVRCQSRRQKGQAGGVLHHVAVSVQL